MEKKKIQKRKEEQKNLEKEIFKIKLEHMEFKLRKKEKGGKANRRLYLPWPPRNNPTKTSSE